MSRIAVMAGWDDVPHLTESAKAELESSYLPHQKSARMRGVPSLGSGAIYPVAESDYVIDPIDLPDFWPRICAMDVGWKRTAALWGAWDRENDIVYLYSEHYMGEQHPAVHAEAVKARGAWIPILMDPQARGRSQIDGQRLFKIYLDMGLKVRNANKAIESGIYQVYARLQTGRLKVFRTLTELMHEIRMYRRDHKGKVVKENDHLMDCKRYLIMGYRTHAIVQPISDFAYPGSRTLVGDRRAGY